MYQRTLFPPKSLGETNGVLSSIEAAINLMKGLDLFIKFISCILIVAI